MTLVLVAGPKLAVSFLFEPGDALVQPLLSRIRTASSTVEGLTIAAPLASISQRLASERIEDSFVLVVVFAVVAGLSLGLIHFHSF